MEDVSHLGKKIFTCDSESTITTFITEACQELLNIQKIPLNYTSRRMLFLWKLNYEVSFCPLRKQNRIVSTIIKVNVQCL